MLALKRMNELESLPPAYHVEEKNYQIRFLLKLIPLESNIGSNAFKDKKILFLVSEDKIVKAILMEVGTSEKGCELEVKERSIDGQEIILEDQSGLIRMILKLDLELSQYIATINHPINQYWLDAVSLHG